MANHEANMKCGCLCSDCVAWRGSVRRKKLKDCLCRYCSPKGFALLEEETGMIVNCRWDDKKDGGYYEDGPWMPAKVTS